MKANLPLSDSLVPCHTSAGMCQPEGVPWHLLLSHLLAIVSIPAIVIAASTTARAQYPAPPPIPPVRQELIAVEPSTAHVWVPGSWERAGQQWNWVAGRWEQPPNAMAHWVTGYWKLEGSGYQWHAGHWGVVSTGIVVQEPVAIPAMVPEVVPAIPASGGTWVPGRWEWRAGQWVWLAGYYVQPPHPQARWVPGQWARGQLGFWRWLPGHWTS